MVKLTHYASKGGCACKIGSYILSRVLSQIQWPSNDRVLVDNSRMDDGGVYLLDEKFGLVQTLDFFTPIVDDPFTFGQIAAANSISDIYAMGGRPITGMNIVGFPISLVEKGILTEVLLGAASILKEEQVALVGGHSIENETPIFGMSVTGVVNPKNIWKNSGAQVGDALILTKPIGTGIMSTALKGEILSGGVQEAVKSMITTNRKACEIAQNFTVHSCTDITGFSLLGHAREMAVGSNVTIELDSHMIPLFEGLLEIAQMGLIPAATYGNRNSISNVSISEKLASVWSDICFDPQTSGGLLLAVPNSERDDIVEALHRAGLVKASAIGRVMEHSEIAVNVQ